MDKAAARLAGAVRTAETIAIFGDYDVDGATSAALLTMTEQVDAARRVSRFVTMSAAPLVRVTDRLLVLP